jgi:hypothetical protein
VKVSSGNAERACITCGAPAAPAPAATNDVAASAHPDMEAKPNRRARNRHCIGRNGRTFEVVMTRLPLRVSTSLMAMWNLFNACAGSVAAGAVAAAVFRNSLRGRIMATSFLADIGIKKARYSGTTIHPPRYAHRG